MDLDQKEKKLQERQQRLAQLEQEILEKEKALKLKEKQKKYFASKGGLVRAEKTTHPATSGFLMARYCDLGGRRSKKHQFTNRIYFETSCESAQKTIKF